MFRNVKNLPIVFFGAIQDYCSFTVQLLNTSSLNVKFCCARPLVDLNSPLVRFMLSSH